MPHFLFPRKRVHATALAADAAAEEEVLEEEEDAVAGELERERGGRGGVDGGGGEGEGEDGRRERGDSGASDEQSEADTGVEPVQIILHVPPLLVGPAVPSVDLGGVSFSAAFEGPL